VLAGAALLSGIRAGRDRANLVTDGALWIWFRLDIGEREPIHFYASRRFRLDSEPGEARAKLFVDPRGVLTVNGRRFLPVEQRPGSSLAVFEIAPALVEGENRLVVEAESPSGAGGILFCLDLPEGRRVVSDSSWRVSLTEPAAPGEDRPAAVWGRPPMYPWCYPKVEPPP
jgi:hypothetical protein